MQFDHVIHFIGETPEQAVDFWRLNKLHAVIGGRHDKWGTRNALLYGKNSYIEWLAIENREIAESAGHPLTQLLLRNGPGFGTVCFRVESVEELEDRLRSEGFQTSGILDGSRRTAEGKLIEWEMLFIKEDFSDGLPFPFFIEWKETDEERYHGLQASGAINSTNENNIVERCIFGVEDVEKTARIWTALLGGSLQLPNCLMEFRKRTGPNERLEEVCFRDGEKRVLYENGVYVI